MVLGKCQLNTSKEMHMFKKFTDWLFRRSAPQAAAAAPYKVEAPAAEPAPAKKSVRAKKSVVVNKTTKKKS